MSSWNTEITQAGLTMLSRSIAGETLFFSGEAVGNLAEDAGRVAYGTGGRSIRIDRNDSGMTIVVRLDNPYTGSLFGTEAGKSVLIDTVNLYARIEGEARVLFCSTTSETGVVIPPLDSIDAFTVDLSIPIVLSNAAAVNVSIAESAYATESRLQAASSALETKITALESKLTGWVCGLLNEKNIFLAGRFEFTIESSEWQYDSDSECYYAELPVVCGIEFPRSSMAPFDDRVKCPLAVLDFSTIIETGRYMDSKKTAAAYGVENIAALRPLTAFNAERSRMTGYNVFVVYVYAHSRPLRGIQGSCFILSPQSVSVPSEADERDEQYTESISNITVSGTQVSATISTGYADSVCAFCVHLNASGAFKGDTGILSGIRQGSDTYTFTLENVRTPALEDGVTAGDIVRIFVVRETQQTIQTLSTQTYTEPEPEGEPEGEPSQEPAGEP